MCDWGSEEARYDFTAAWNKLWQAFTSDNNAKYLKQVYNKLGYGEVDLSHLRPWMAEVFSTTQINGYDPSRCYKNTYSVQQLNDELIEYTIPIFENYKMSARNYIMDQKYFRPIDRAQNASCKRRQLFYNNRFP